MDEAIAADRETAAPAALPGPGVQSPHHRVAENYAVPSGTDAVLLSVVVDMGAIRGLAAGPVTGALLGRTASLGPHNLPLVVAPLAAGVVLGLMNSYPALFALSGFVTIIATWTVSRARSVR